MGYINVTRGGKAPEDYINVGLKHKGTIYTPEINQLSLTLTPYNSSNPPAMTSDFVAGPFTSSTRGYSIPPTTLWPNYSTITSFECITKYKFNSMPSDVTTVVGWEKLFQSDYGPDGNLHIWSFTASSHTYHSTTPVTTDTWYWLKINIDSSRNVTYSLSTDGENYTQLVSFTDNAYSWSSVYSYRIGYGYFYYGSNRVFNSGVIDFKGTSIKINGNDILYYFHQNYGEH